MFKNVASQKITLVAFDSATGKKKTGDASNQTFYVSKDDGAVTVLGTPTPTEMDATNAPGCYSGTLTQAETNADKLVFTGKSSTSGIEIVPQVIYTSALQTGDAYARLGAPAGASIAADLAAVKTEEDAIKAKTDLIGLGTSRSSLGR